MEHVQVIAFWLAFLFYAAAFVFFLYYLFSKREAQNRAGLLFAVVGLVASRPWPSCCAPCRPGTCRSSAPTSR